MIAKEREKKILEILESKKIIKVTDLSTQLNATEATIRRDLEKLQGQNRLKRVHGGAVPIRKSSQRLSQEHLATIHIEEKKRIAKKAYEFIDNHDAIILGLSTTVKELAKIIVAGEKSSLSIITNSFGLVDLLRVRSDFRIIHTGGQLDNQLNSSLGTLAESMLKNVKVEKCFIGANGIDPIYGYSSPTFEEASITSRILEAGKLRFLLCDHTKFGETYMGKFAEYKDGVDYIITDELPPHHDIARYEDGPELILADTANDHSFES